MAKAIASQPDKSSAYVPEVATTDHGHAYPRLPQSPPFLLVADSQRWHVMGGRVVPALHQQALAPGVDLVTADGRGRWQLARLRARIEEQGRTIVPVEAAPDGVSYIQRVDTKVGSEVRDTYITVWETAHAGDTRTSTDIDAYSTWCAGLVDDGYIAPCPPYRLSRMLEDARTSLMHAEAAYRRTETPTHAQQVEACKANIEVIEKALGTEPKGKKVAGKSVVPAGVEG